MPSNKRDEDEKISGGGEGEDGLEHAAHQISKANDTMLASLFVEANNIAKNNEIAENQELFEEKKEEYEFHEHIPDPSLCKSIYESLSNKDIHHKKLLEEGVSPNFFVNLLNKFKKFFNLKVTVKKKITLEPRDWKVFSIFCKAWRKKTSFYLNDFSSQIDLFLRSPKTTISMLRIEFASIFTILVLSVIIMIVSSRNVYSFSDVYSKWSLSIFAFSVISVILSSIPPFFFFSLWFSNVNHLHTSRNFHFFLFSTITLSFIFVSLAIFNIGLFYLFNWRFG